MNSKRFDWVARHTSITALLLIAYLMAFFSSPAAALEFESALHDFEVEVVAEGLEHPWGLAFISDDDILVTERTGQLRRIRNGKLQKAPLAGLPVIEEIGQGGLLGIVLHPGFDQNDMVYLSYAGEQNGRYGTEVLRGRLEDNRLVDTEVIFRALPKERRGYHFGSRLVFAADGTLFISLGDRGADPDLASDHPAQSTGNHIGTLIRVNDDGSIPADNPFVSTAGARSEVYTYGNRNMQGMARRPGTDDIWTHEHGPQGGDEINIMRPGRNYGWPVITYGANYGTGTQIGIGTHKQGMEQPLYKWVPSIAPSGMVFYTGDKFPQWQGDLFVGSLKFGQLVRLELQDDTITHEERLFNFEYGRIRDVVQGPDGYIYLLTDSENGRLLRLVPRR